MYVGSPYETNRRLEQFVLIYFHTEPLISITFVHGYYWMFNIIYQPFISSPPMQLNMSVLNYVSFSLHTQNGHVYFFLLSILI